MEIKTKMMTVEIRKEMFCIVVWKTEIFYGKIANRVGKRCFVIKPIHSQEISGKMIDCSAWRYFRCQINFILSRVKFITHFAAPGSIIIS